MTRIFFLNSSLLLNGAATCHSVQARPLRPSPRTHLVLPLQREDVGDFPKRQAQRDDFRLRRLVGQLPDVKHPRRRRLLHPQLLTVAAIGCPV